MPPAAGVHCRYLAEGVRTKLRWNLSVDDSELAGLKNAATSCPDQTVTHEPAP